MTILYGTRPNIRQAQAMDIYQHKTMNNDEPNIKQAQAMAIYQIG